MIEVIWPPVVAILLLCFMVICVWGTVKFLLWLEKKL